MATNQTGTAQTPIQAAPSTSSQTAGGAAPTSDFGTSIPQVVNQTTAGVQQQPLYAGETPAMQAARNANQAKIDQANNGGVINTKAGQTTIGDAFANGVRDQNVIGSFQNNGDQGTGGTSMTTTGTGTIAKPENINTPLPMGQGEIEAAKNAQTPPVTTPGTVDSGGNFLNATEAQRNADMQYASDIRKAAGDFGTKLDNFTGSFKDDMGEFLNNQTNAYKSIVDNMQSWVSAQTGQLKTLGEKYMATMEKYSANMESEKNDAIATTNANAKTMTDFANIDKELALKQNELASKQSANMYASQLDQANENQSRYLGFLTGKFEANGMANSGAGLQLIAKYMAAGQGQINALSQESSNSALMFVAKGNEIINSFAKQSFQIEAQRQSDTRTIRNDYNKQMLQIENDKFKTQEQITMEQYGLAKDYNSMLIDVKSKAFSETMAVKNQALQEAQFSHGVIQDQIKNQQWEQSFDRGVLESNRSFDLQEKQENRAKDAQLTNDTGNLYINGRDTGQRALQGASFDQQVKAFNQGVRQWDATFQRGIVESDRSYILSRDQFNLAKDNGDFQRSLTIAEKGLASNPTFAKYLKPEDIVGMGAYVSQKDGKVTSMGERVASALSTAANNVDKAFQCVQFVRKIVPDLPSGLYTLSDKIKALTQGNYAIDAPAPGAVVVLDWKTPQEKGLSPDQYAGHVAVVKSVDEKNGTFTIVDYNGSGGAYKPGEKTIKMNNGNVKGYWMSPNVQGGQTQTQSPVQQDFGRVTALLPENVRNSAKAAFDGYVKSGDTAGAENYVNSIALQKLPAKSQSEIMTYNKTYLQADQFLKNLKSDTASGMYKKLENDTRKWRDIAQDPQYADMIGKISIIQAPLQNEIYGASVTDKEFEQAKNWLIQPDDKTVDIIRKTKNLMEFSKGVVHNNLDAAKGNILGEGNGSKLGDLLSKYGL